MRLQLLSDRVLVKPTVPEEVAPKTKNVPTKRESRDGMVIAVGPGCKREDGSRDEMPLKPGDEVVFERDVYATHVFLNGQQYLALTEGDIIGIVREGTRDGMVEE